MDQATRVAWSTAGLRKSSLRLPCVLGSLSPLGFTVNSFKLYSGLLTLSTFAQREGVALGTLFFPFPVVRLSSEAGAVLGKLVHDTLGQQAAWEYDPMPRRVLGKSILSLFCRAVGGPKKLQDLLRAGDVDRVIHVLQNPHTAPVPGSVPTAASLTWMIE